MQKQIDLNSDLGEGFGAWPMGDDTAMMQMVTSANIACGGHAGDAETMFKTISLAAANNVTIGAHPGFNDRQGFGRRIIQMNPDEITRLSAAQIGALVGVAALVPAQVKYVKAHGALANLAAKDRPVADAIVKAAKMIDPKLAILAISGTEIEHAAKEAGMSVASEIFADRGYLSNGQLVPRGQDGAMIHDADVAADRLVTFLETGLMPVIDGDPIPLKAHSICVHGDGPSAVAMTRRIRERLLETGVTFNSFKSL